MSKASGNYREKIRRDYGFKYTSKDYKRIKRIYQKKNRIAKIGEQIVNSIYNQKTKYEIEEAYKKGWWDLLPIGYKGVTKYERS